MLARSLVCFGLTSSLMLASVVTHAADSGFTISGGVLAGGKLFRATSDANRNWETADGRRLGGTEVRTEIDEFASFALRANKAMGSQWGLSGGFSAADADVKVLLRTAAGAVDKLDWDQVLFLNADVNAFYDLVAEGSTAYVFGGLGLSIWSGEGNSGLDQTVPALVLGAGYRIRGFGFDIDLEARDSIAFSNFDDEESRLDPDGFESFDPTHLWTFSAGWTYVF